jgi:hypothetical protein
MTTITAENFKKFRNCPFCKEKMTLVTRKEKEHDSHKFSTKYYCCDKHVYNDKNYKVIFKSEKPWLFILESFSDPVDDHTQCDEECGGECEEVNSFLEFRGAVFKFKKENAKPKTHIEKLKSRMGKDSEDMLIFLHKVGAQLAIQKEMEFFDPSEMTFEQVVNQIDYLYLYDF